MAVPLLSMRLGQTDAGNNPDHTTSRKAYDLVAEGFGPGVNGPLLLAGRPRRRRRRRRRRAARSSSTACARTPTCSSPRTPSVNAGGDAAIVT